MKKIALTAVVLSFFAHSSMADEWKKCEVTKSMANNRDVAIALGKSKIYFGFLKKTNYSYIAMHVDGNNVKNADLIATGRRQYSDGTYFIGYADKTNTLRIQEFEDSPTMIISMSGDVDFTFFVSCI